MALILACLIGIAAGVLAEDNPSEGRDSDFDMRFRNGGSFSLEPAFFMPTGALSQAVENTLGYNADFDIGVNPDISVTFGAGYFNMPGKGNPDFQLTIAPAWFGVKSKNQFLPEAEIYWEGGAALFYEKAFFVRSSVGSQENLDWGPYLNAGFDVWWTRLILTGLAFKVYGIVEQGELFPAAQLGLRVGIRG